MYSGTPLAPHAETLEREFPRRGEGIYLNSAAQGILPRRALEAMAAFERGRAHPHPVDDERLVEIEALCRDRIAALTGAPLERVGLAVNTSDGLHVAALHLPLAAGDRVLLARGEFPANVYPWMGLARRGVETRFLEPDGPHLSAGRVAEALDADPRIRAVSLSLVQFSTGHRNPVEAIGAVCRERGVRFVVDGIQGIGAVPFRWDDELYDLVACGGQKWLLAPWGSGFFLAGERLCREAEPVRPGWLQVRGVREPPAYSRLCDYELSFRPDATRFEVGTYAYTALLGLAESAGLLTEVGVERIAGHVAALLEPLEALLDERGAEVVSCRRPECRSAIFCFRLDGEAATRDLFERLGRAGVRCAYREGAIRISPHLYNTPDEVDRALETVAGAWPAGAGSA